MERGYWYKLVGLFTIVGAIAAVLVVPEFRRYVRLDEQPPPPPPISSEESCYNGIWKENEPNELTWTFRLQNNILRIERSDGFIAGIFKRDGDNWLGTLVFDNGAKWDNVTLYRINHRCDEIKTDQRWKYHR